MVTHLEQFRPGQAGKDAGFKICGKICGYQNA